MALYKRGQFWWVSICRNGRRVQKSTKLKDYRSARAVEHALMLTGEAQDGSGARISAGTDNDEGRKRGFIKGLLEAVYGGDTDRTKLTDLWDEYLGVVRMKGLKLRERTLSEKRSDFKIFLRWCGDNGVKCLDEVTATVAQRFAKVLADRCAVKRRSNLIRNISSVWNAVLPAHGGVTNPWPQVAPVIDMFKTMREGFTREEEIRVMDAAKKIHEQWFVACLIGRHTGMRYGDVCNLIRSNLDLDKGVISYTPHKTMDSSGIKVDVPMSGVLKECLSSWVSEHSRMTEYDKVLPWLQERSPKGNKRFSAVLKKAGISPKRYSFHSWRHTCASRLAEAGVSMEIRKKILGHTTDVMAERYNHADLTEEMRSAVEKAGL